MMPHHCHALLSICRVETSARVMTAASGLSGCNALEAASPAVAASITGRDSRNVSSRTGRR